MEPIYLVNKNSGLEYEVITIVFYLDKDCYKVKPCAYRYSAVPYIYIPIADVGADKEYYIKEYYIKETDTDKEESLYLVKGDKSYKILGTCKVGPDLVYRIDLPSPQISPYSPRLSPYILKSVVDAGCYSIKTKAEVDKMQEVEALRTIKKVDLTLRLGHYTLFAKTDGVYIKLIVPGNITEALIYPF